MLSCWRTRYNSNCAVEPSKSTTCCQLPRTRSILFASWWQHLRSIWHWKKAVWTVDFLSRSCRCSHWHWEVMSSWETTWPGRAQDTSVHKAHFSSGQTGIQAGEICPVSKFRSTETCMTQQCLRNDPWGHSDLRATWPLELQGPSKVKCISSWAGYSCAGRWMEPSSSRVSFHHWMEAGMLQVVGTQRTEDPALKHPSEHLKTAPTLATFGLLWFLQSFLTGQRTMTSCHLSVFLSRQCWEHWPYPLDECWRLDRNVITFAFGFQGDRRACD